MVIRKEKTKHDKQYTDKLMVSKLLCLNCVNTYKVSCEDGHM